MLQCINWDCLTMSGFISSRVNLSGDLLKRLEVAEISFRKYVSESQRTLRNIPTTIIFATQHCNRHWWNCRKTLCFLLGWIMLLKLKNYFWKVLLICIWRSEFHMRDIIPYEFHMRDIIRTDTKLNRKKSKNKGRLGRTWKDQLTSIETSQ